MSITRWVSPWGTTHTRSPLPENTLRRGQLAVHPRGDPLGNVRGPRARTYVNDLVSVEWYTVDGVHPEAGGISRAGATRLLWRFATAYPEAFDAVRRELGAETREAYEWT